MEKSETKRSEVIKNFMKKIDPKWSNLKKQDIYVLIYVILYIHILQNSIMKMPILKLII